MRNKHAGGVRFAALGLGAWLLFAFAPAKAGAQVAVHRITGTISETAETFHPKRFFGGRVKVSEYVQLAQGQDPDEKPPRDEVLALVYDCDAGNAQIVVLDTDPVAILANLTEVFDVSDFALTLRKIRAVADFDIAASGNSTYGLQGGEGHLFISGSFFADGPLEGCLKTARIDMIGYNEITVLGDTIRFLIQKSVLSIKKPFDFTLPPPVPAP